VTLPPPEGWTLSYQNDTIQEAWGIVCWSFLHKGRMEAPSRAAFELDESMHTSPRHYGGCTLDGLTVKIAPSIAELPRDVMLGVLAHEAGHVEDFCNPDTYGLVRGKLIYKAAPLPRRTSHQIEVIADKIAGLAGYKIGYVDLRGVGWIECLGRGVARPKGLR